MFAAGVNFARKGVQEISPGAKSNSIVSLCHVAVIKVCRDFQGDLIIHDRA